LRQVPGVYNSFVAWPRVSVLDEYESL
jgi:hypothetical protein